MMFLSTRARASSDCRPFYGRIWSRTRWSLTMRCWRTRLQRKLPYFVSELMFASCYETCQGQRLHHLRREMLSTTVLWGSDFPACFSTRFESSYSWHRDDRGICGVCRYHWGMASRKRRMGLYIRIMGCLEQGMLQPRFVKHNVVCSRMEEMFTFKPKMLDMESFLETPDVLVRIDFLLSRAVTRGTDAVRATGVALKLL